MAAKPPSPPVPSAWPVPTREERKAIRLAQAAIRECVPGWEDLFADAALALGYGPEDMARRARRRLVEWAVVERPPRRD